jgi:hypothetical protein
MAFEGVPFTKIMSPPELKSLAGHMRPAGRTLAMSVINYPNVTL